MTPADTSRTRPAAGAGALARFEARAGIIKALAHPVRLMIVDELGRGERCVCELRGLAGLDMSTVSKHLSLLKNAGIVADRKSGLNVYYRLCCPCLNNFFSCIEGILKRHAQAKLKELE